MCIYFRLCSAGNTGEAVQSLGQEDPLEEEMATHSSILAWKIPWTEEPGGLQSMGVTKNQTQMSERAQDNLLYKNTFIFTCFCIKKY